MVVNGFGDAPVSLCAGPGIHAGPSTDTPNIGLTSGGIVLHAGLARTSDDANALLVQSYGSTGAGSYTNPMVEWWDAAGTWFENAATDGTFVIDAWPAVGERVTGTFSGTPYNMGGPGPASYSLSGTFCAIRVADR